MSSTNGQVNTQTPFALKNIDQYKQWRDDKLKAYPQSLSDLVVEINDPRKLSKAEHLKILTLAQQTNMVIYASTVGNDADPEIP